MTVIVDYGMGNLRSVEKALQFIGEPVCISDRPEDVLQADRLVLPGVGAAKDAMARLQSSGLADAVLQDVHAGTPLLGICLGMQLLFDLSLEGGRTSCLGLIPGEVVPFDAHLPGGLRIPHMGWNEVEQADGLLSDTSGRCFYFVHSYHAAGVPEENIRATCFYGYRFVCAVSAGNVYGVQFHPEKSGSAGLELLLRFTRERHPGEEVR